MGQQPTVVIDIDDTLLHHVNRDYANAEPDSGVIMRMRDIHSKGFKIVLYTARGMKSCYGDADAARKKNEPTLLEWLYYNDVPFDELVFGKPLGDMYVDDKCMLPSQFANSSFYEMAGNSGRELWRLGNVVKKNLGSSALEGFQDWYEDAGAKCRYPRVVSYCYDSVVMEYVDGDCLADNVDYIKALNAVDLMLKFATFKRKGFDTEHHVAKLFNNVGIAPDEMLECVASMMRGCDAHMQELASFCHGDYTFSNMIWCKGSLVLIDPNYCRGASSFILDAAKLLMSFDGFDLNVLGRGCKGFNGFGNRLKITVEDVKDKMIEAIDEMGCLHELFVYEAMQLLRTLRYLDADKREAVLGMAREAITCAKTFQGLA